MKYILSRAYVEFGPFEAGEIVEFSGRGLIRSGDFIRAERSHHWDPWEVWIHHHTNPSVAEKKAAAPAKKVAAPAKKVAAPAKKSATKKAAAKAPAKKSPPPES